ncbi:hypothetical protein [Aneurinibacillus terranovensis]|uniref:hypothetical protein n=1 Tax=Aneurinibacillus terranovensis TaxID=278991 RepID=UPI0012DDF947
MPLVLFLRGSETATRSTSKKQRSAHSREFFSGDQWKESICCFTVLKQHILSLTVKKRKGCALSLE